MERCQSAVAIDDIIHMSTPRASRLSPSRMNDFLGCEYRTWLDLERGKGRVKLVEIPRPDAELLKQRGIAHEQRFLDELIAAGRDVLRLDCNSPSEQARLTETAMIDGREVIHQACFLDDGWIGYADFLVRIDEPSDRWAWSYEVHDAKLARHPKPNYIFQLLFYSDQVQRLQGGTRPRRMHLIMGDGERPPFAPDEFDAYAEQVRRQFLTRRAELDAGAKPAYPYPVADCDFCPWWQHCKDKRRDEDHLSLVAMLQRRHGLLLEDVGVHSVAQVADLDADAKVPHLASATLAGLREQADLQLRSRGLDVPLHNLREPEHGRGLHRLPEPSVGDVFFDFEGDPYWGDDGLEYLFGTVYRDEAGEWVYWPLWAHDRAEERAAFERWMAWITDRLARYPDLHVFHFNHYEPTTLKKLMTRYAVCENQVNELLRRHVLVDLYSVLRQSMRVGTESYGLKAIEALYAFRRNPEMGGGSGAARAYEAWRESGDHGQLARIALYNDDDCRSTQALYEWLLARRPDAETQYNVELAILAPKAERELSDKALAWIARLDELREALTTGLSEDEAVWSDDDRTRRRMADLIDYHQREKRPAWWAYFARLGMSPDELCADDPEAIGGLVLAADLPGRDVANSYEYPMRFPEQQWKVTARDELVDPVAEKGVNVVEIDEDERILWIRRAKNRADEALPRAVIPAGPLPTHAQEEALLVLGERVRHGGLASTGDLDASIELLAARDPRFCVGTPPLSTGPVDLRVLCDQVAALDRSTLFIQGPPGTGKTYTGGRLAVDLMRRGRRVGVAATSHKAICKLLEEIEVAADAAQVDFKGIQKPDGDGESAVTSDRIEIVRSASDCASADDDIQLIAGTAWLWARADMRAKVDVLFIDEAGQVALADALAMAQAARSVVLLGDPQQLAHVSQATHPRDSGRSVLEHLLGDHHTIPVDRGVFLERTWRMHPDVCRFVSDTMYDGRLEPIPGLELQEIASRGLNGSGLRMLTVEHVENRVSSIEEARRIRLEIDVLLDAGRWCDRHGAWHHLTLADILVVAPYNAQVRRLRRELPPGARVGTVDKFQGQQAPVVFFSMASSSSEDVPRGMDFLFSRNRLNVAVSRAQAMTVVVCSPRLLWSRCSTVEQMRLVNMLCRFGSIAGE